MSFIGVIDKVRDVWSRIELLKEMLKKYAIKIDKYDDTIFTFLNAFKSFFPPAVQLAIELLEKYEKQLIDELDGIEEAEETGVKGKEKTNIAVASCLPDVDPKLIKTVTEFIDKPEELNINIKEEDKNTVDTVIEKTKDVISIVGLINSLVKGR